MTVSYVEEQATAQRRRPGIRVGTRVTFLASAADAKTKKAARAVATSVLPKVGKIAATALSKFGASKNGGAVEVRAGTKVVEVKTPVVPRRPPPPPPRKRP